MQTEENSNLPHQAKKKKVLSSEKLFLIYVDVYSIIFVLLQFFPLGLPCYILVQIQGPLRKSKHITNAKHYFPKHGEIKMLCKDGGFGRYAASVQFILLRFQIMKVKQTKQ